MRLKYLDKLYEILGLEHEDIKRQAAFSVFTEAVMFKVLTRTEALAGLSAFRSNIFKLNSIKWKIGFLFLWLGQGGIASKLVHY